MTPAPDTGQAAFAGDGGRCALLRWMRGALLAAALYNVAFGVVTAAVPQASFSWITGGTIDHPEVWQCLGMVIGVYGVGYAIAARDPLRHWPIVLVGLLGKFFGPAGFLWAALHETLPWRMGWLIVFNDLIWWWPFTAILLAAIRCRRKSQMP